LGSCKEQIEDSFEKNIRQLRERNESGIEIQEDMLFDKTNGLIVVCWLGVDMEISEFFSLIL